VRDRVREHQLKFTGCDPEDSEAHDATPHGVNELLSNSSSRGVRECKSEGSDTVVGSAFYLEGKNIDIYSLPTRRINRSH
jgi:hypothetical protein